MSRQLLYPVVSSQPLRAAPPPRVWQISHKGHNQPKQQEQRGVWRGWRRGAAGSGFPVGRPARRSAPQPPGAPHGSAMSAAGLGHSLGRLFSPLNRIGSSRCIRASHAFSFGKLSSRPGTHGSISASPELLAKRMSIGYTAKSAADTCGR